MSKRAEPSLSIWALRNADDGAKMATEMMANPC
jgi:hypothetical protein